MALIIGPNVDAYRLNTGQTKDNYDPHFWDDANKLPEKTYLTYPYSLKKPNQATTRARP